jgi:fibronectin type 3 domain-containing protein
MRKTRFLLLLGLLLFFSTVAFGQNQNVTVTYGLQVGPPHSAELHWPASISAGVTGYNIYRSNVSGSGYVKIGSVGGSVLTYTDGGLPAGNTYFYVVTTVGTGGESAFSSQVTGVVATP